MTSPKMKRDPYKDSKDRELQFGSFHKKKLGLMRHGTLAANPKGRLKATNALAMKMEQESNSTSMLNSDFDLEEELDIDDNIEVLRNQQVIIDGQR